MSIFVIADLHLSLSVDKPMDVFGSHWLNHHEKIKRYWIEMIKDDDLVLIPGDISWAMNLDEAMVDLEWIHRLPGKKVLVRGNHDYWWGSITRMNKLFDDMVFLQNNSFIYEDISICGTRGWICPNENKFTEKDKKVYDRELKRIELSLDSAIKKECKNIIVMSHYPPTNDKLESSGFTQIYEKYNIKEVVYGHLHGKESFEVGLQGEYNGVKYYLTSSDYLDFKPLKIL